MMSNDHAQLGIGQQGFHQFHALFDVKVHFVPLIPTQVRFSQQNLVLNVGHARVVQGGRVF